MNQKKAAFVSWVKAHRKQLITSGISITILLGTILCIKKQAVLVELFEAIKAAISDHPRQVYGIEVDLVDSISESEQITTPRGYTLPSKPVNTKWYIRSLPVGKTHSQAKADEAVAMGIVLLDNQTIVDSYTRFAS